MTATAQPASQPSLEGALLMLVYAIPAVSFVEVS
jgi:hypothetical protein